MTRRIALLVAATTSAVVVAFIVPLCFLVANLAQDRATTRAREQAQGVSTLVATVGDRDALERTVSDLSTRGPEVVVVEPDGTVLGRDGVGSTAALAPDTWAAVERARVVQGAFTVEQDHGLDAVVPVVSSRGLEVVVATVLPEELRSGVRGAWATIVGLGLALIALSVAVAFRLGRRTSEPVLEVARVAHALREGDSSARAEPGGPPETAELGRALNALADRIHELVAAERAHAADLGHRLRTPVTALRLDTDLVEDEALGARLREHVDELQRSIDDVVRDARRTARDELPGASSVPPTVADRVDFWRPLAEDQGRDLTLEVSAGAHTPVRLAVQDVREITDTLLDNVFAHTPEGTAARVVVHPGLVGGSTAAVVIVVEDAGPGMPLPYRGRGYSGAGSSGLGLAIVHRVTEAAGGSVDLGTSSLGGLAVAVHLPVAEAAPARHEGAQG
ncbi:MAG TPA: HAMP domain-containing sensor histidine kinase [Ornithinibacter sp.]|nr:HAMP domain-containing sensor histidine kinase [Ornithinibacter sp.]